MEILQIVIFGLCVSPLAVSGLSATGENVCTFLDSYPTYSRKYYYDGCGWLAWGRCQFSKSVETYKQKIGYKCCDGWHSTDDESCTQAKCHGLPPGICPNGGSCVKPDVCLCDIGFEGQQCTDIDECSVDNGGCSHLCSNTGGSYACYCHDGFDLTEDSHTCSPLCYEQTPGTCPNGGTCFSPGLCMCAQGFEVPDCKDVDECADDNSGCDQMCENIPGSYRCHCPSGFYLQQDLKTCDNSSVEECSKGEDFSSCPKCAQVFLDECSCPIGLFLYHDESTCIPSCAYDVCLNGGQCQRIMTDGFFTYDDEENSTVPLVKPDFGFDCNCSGTGFAGKYCERNLTTTIESTTMEAVSTTSEPSQILSTEAHSDSPQPDIQTTTDIFDSPLALNISDWLDFNENATDEALRISDVLKQCGFEASSANKDVMVSIDAPERVSFGSGNRFEDLTVKLSSVETVTVVVCAEDGLDVSPTELNITAETSSITMQLNVRVSGSYILLFMHPNSEKELAKVEVRYEDIYSRLGLRTGEIPSGQFHLDLTLHKTNMRLSSTSQWCTSSNSGNLYFTKGVVYSASGGFSLPISFSGLEVTLGRKLITGPLSSRRDFAYCKTLKSDGKVKREMSWSAQVIRHLKEEEEEELTQSDAVLGTLFNKLRDKLPSWIRLYINPTIRQPGRATVQMMTGFFAQRLSSCFAAPLHEDRVYHVYRFTQTYSVYFLDSKKNLPNLDPGSGEYCVIVDLNIDNGTTVFMTYPGNSGSALMKGLAVLKNNFNEDFEFIPTSLGVSFPAGLNGHRRPRSDLSSINDPVYFQAVELIDNPAESVSFWNGDTMASFAMPKEVSLYSSFHISFSPESAKWFEVKTSMEMFVSLPDLSKTFKTFIEEPWRMFFRSISGFSLLIKFPIAGKMQTIDLNNISPNLFSVDVAGYGSFGGSDEREYCGRDANPPGIFFEANINAKLFRGIPYLEGKVAELSFSSADIKVQVFKITDDHQISYGMLKEFDELLVPVQTYAKTAEEFLNSRIKQSDKAARDLVQTDLDKVILLLSDIQRKSQHMVAKIRRGSSVEELNDVILKDITEISDLLDSMIDRLQRQYFAVLSSLLKKMSEPINKMREAVAGFLVKVYRTIFDSVNGAGSFGFKGRFSIIILGELYAVEGYFIKADSQISRCGIYSQFYDHMKGEKSVRVGGKIELPIQILPKVKIDAGFGLEVAVSMSSSNFVVKLHASAKFLGKKVKIDLFINNKGLHSIYEANIYDIFRSRVTLSANVFVPVVDWYVLLRVEFLPGGDGFEGSLLDVLKNYVKKLAQDAYKRIQSAQNTVEGAKQHVKKAKQVMHNAKKSLEHAKDKITDAIATLERAKAKVEAAKAPYLKAIDWLNKVQKRVDSLCKIKTCKSICIPGIKARLCWAGWFPYPCFSWTNCMIRLPNPICVLKNVGCRVVRGLAYAALAIAKFAVHIPMIAYDIAKLAISSAEVVVSLGYAAVDVAHAALDFADLALDGVIILMNVAKAALEVVKIAVRFGYQIFEYIVDYGLKKLFDIKICGFEVVVSTKDLFEFEIFCNINPFGLGWRNVGFRINFNNLLSSLWNAVKSIASQFMGIMKNAFGRRKREVDRDILHRLHHILRAKRDTENTYYENQSSAGGLFGDYFKNGTILSNISWEHGAQFWRERCAEYIPVYSFLYEAVQTLYNASSRVNAEVESVLIRTENQTLEEVEKFETVLSDDEINFDVALSDFNITREELMEALRKVNVSQDDLFQQSKNASSTVHQYNLDGAELASKYDILTQWKTELVNISKKHFTNEECFGYTDCVVWSFLQLYQIFSSVENRLVPGGNANLADLEDILYELLDNNTKNVHEVKNMSEHALDKLASVRFDSIFCGTAPVIEEYPFSQTIIEGSVFSFTCRASSVPDPYYYWYKDDEMYTHGSSHLVFTNVSKEDAGNFTCVAGNHILNVSTKPATLTVVYAPVILTPLPIYITLISGEEVTLNCQTSSKPAAKTVWTSTAIINTTQEDRLAFVANDSLPSGLYTCMSFNEYGLDQSTEVLVDVKPSQPASPSVQIEVGFVIVSTLPTSAAEQGLEESIAKSAREILNQGAADVDVLLVDINNNLDIVILQVQIDCENVSACIMQECKGMYTNYIAHLYSAIDLLLEAVNEEGLIFERNELKVYFSRGLVDIGLIIPRCPTNHYLKFNVLCVYADQLFHISEPTDLDLEDSGDNLTISWRSPLSLQYFIKGYIIVVQSIGKSGSDVIVNTTCSQPYWMMAKSLSMKYLDVEMVVQVLAFTDTQLSAWAEKQTTIHTPSSTSETTMVFAVAMAVLFAVVLVIVILGAIYHVRAPRLKVRNESPPPPYTVEKGMPDIALKFPATKPAWS